MTAEEKENALFILDCLLTVNVAKRNKALDKKDPILVHKNNREIIELIQKINKHRPDQHYYGV